MRQQCFYIKYYCLLLVLVCISGRVLSQTNQITEKIHLNSDKSSYLAGEIIWFNIELNSLSLSDSNISSIAYVELSNSNGVSVQQGKIEINDNTGIGNFYLPINLPSGIYTLLAYTSQLKNAGAKNFAYKKISVINTITGAIAKVSTTNNLIKDQIPTNTTPIKITSNKTNYSTREELEVTLAISDLSQSDILHGSLSIVYMGENSKINGKERQINTPLTVVDTTNSSARKRFLPEYDGHIVTAKVINSWNQQPASNVNCALSIPSSVPFGFYTGISDENGIVRFNVKKYFGNGDIVIKAFPQKNPESYSFEIESPFLDSLHLPHYAETLLLNDDDSVELKRRSIAMQAGNIYFEDSLNKFQLPNFKDTLPFFGKAEFRYTLDDYKRFTTMEEILREYVTNINVQLRNSKLKMTIFDEKEGRIFDNSILVLLDGVPLYEYNNIFNYDPLKVKRLDVIPRRYMIGSLVYNGVASFETYNSKFDAFDLDPTATSVPYDGLQLDRKFYSPSYYSKDIDKHLPDLRTTLLWIPNIKFLKNETQKVKAYTSDFKGVYKIVLDGFSKKGISYHGESQFTVE